MFIHDLKYQIINCILLIGDAILLFIILYMICRAYFRCLFK